MPSTGIANRFTGADRSRRRVLLGKVGCDNATSPGRPFAPVAPRLFQPTFCSGNDLKARLLAELCRSRVEDNLREPSAWTYLQRLLGRWPRLRYLCSSATPPTRWRAD